MHETDRVVVSLARQPTCSVIRSRSAQRVRDGMGCSPDGNSGQFTVIVETRVSGNRVTSAYNVQYSGSDEMTDCEVTITEI